MRGFAVACVAALTLLAGGCSSLPDSGQAAPGRDPDPQPERGLRVAPLGPRPGADPVETVAGFLRAGAASDDAEVVARSFLTPTAAAGWRPPEQVIVYPDDRVLGLRVMGTGSSVQVRVSAPVTATIDERGRYAEAVPGTTAKATFGLVRTARGWRVSRVDDPFGAWLPTYALPRSFSAYPVTFVAAGTNTLVPDLRWVPGPGPSLATGLLRQLLAGPPDYLQGAVETGFPVGTTLAVDAVPTRGGVAQVELSERALAATPAQRRMLWAQITSTLRRLPSVSQVELSVDGAPFDVPGIDDTSVYADTAFREDVRVGGAAMVLSGSRLLRVEPATGKLAREGTALPGGAEVGQLAMGPGGGPVVATDRAGRRLLWLTAAESTALLTGRELAPPAVDRTGAVWTADRAVPGRLLVIAAGQLAKPRVAATTIEPAWLTGRTVTALDVSRDGSRAVVVSADAKGGQRVDVAGVVRGVAAAPVSLARPQAVARALAQVTDVTWASAGALVVLGRAAGAKVTRAHQVEVGGPSSPLPEVRDPVSVAAGDGTRALYVTTAAGTVLARSGSGWVLIGPGRSVTVPQ